MHTTLIGADELAAALRSDPERLAYRIRILDCRARLDDPAFGARAYAEGHLPGAVNIPASQVEERATEIRRMGRLPILYCG